MIIFSISLSFIYLLLSPSILLTVFFAVASLVLLLFYIQLKQRYNRLLTETEKKPEKPLSFPEMNFEKLEKLILHFPDAMLVVNINDLYQLQLQAKNQKAADLMNLYNDGLSGNHASFDALIVDLCAELELEDFSDVLNNKVFFEKEVHLKGDYFRLNVFAISERTLTIILSNVSAMKLSIDSLMKSQQKYKSALLALQEGLILVYGDKIREINEVALNLFGVTKKVIGQPIGSLIGFSQWKKLSSLVEKEKILNENMTLYLSAERHVELFISEIEEKVHSFLLLFKDYTKEREQLEEINRLSIFKDNILQAMPSFIFAIGINDEILEANQKVINFKHAKSKEDVIGKKFWEVFPELKKIKSFFSDVRDKNQEILNHKINFNYNGHEMIINFCLYPMNYQNSSLIIVRMDDITNESNIEEQLRQAQKMEIIGHLAGGFVHDFNNILGSISGVISILEYELKDNRFNKESLEKKINIINITLSRAQELLKKLLVLGRKIKSEKKLLDVSELIRESVEIIKGSFPPEIKIKFKKPPFPIYVYADYNHLQQIIVNLLQNAKDAMKEKGDHVFINLWNNVENKKGCLLDNDKEWIQIAVIDNGPGIPYDIVDKVFTPFFTTKDKDTGAGLGLSMVYNLVKEQGGEITLNSEVGKGTSFNIFLPKISDTRALNLLPEEEKIYKGSGHILLVDDEEVIRLVVSNMLARCGYQVTMVNDGQVALNYLEKNSGKVDLILLDLVMPNKNGYETFLEIKKKNLEIPVVIATSFKEDSLAQQILEQGASIVLQKPFTIHKLSKTLFELLGQKSV